MSRFLLIALGAVLLLFAMDTYVYRNWRRYAGGRKALAWTLALYRPLRWVMPLALPLYFATSRWWAVEPKLARAAFIGLWALYYLPKVPLVLGLLVADLARLARRRRGEAPPPPAAGPVMTRGAFLAHLGWTAAAVPFVAVGHGVLRTRTDVAVRRVTVPLAGLPRALDGLSIAQLSDLHAGSLFSDRPMWEAVGLVGDLRPDLVALTGDFVNHDAAELDLILPALRTLRADLGVWGCLGNHDHYAHLPDLLARLATTPVRLLVNAHHTFGLDGARLHLVGTDNTGFRQTFADLPRALAGLPDAPDPDAARVLLAHDPTFWDTHVRPSDAAIDLMLGGHTHGGQIGFELGPFGWSLARTVYTRWAGLYTEPRPGGAPPQHLYVNRGLGTVGPPLRVGIRPEVTLLTLKRA